MGRELKRIQLAESFLKETIQNYKNKLYVVSDPCKGESLKLSFIVKLPLHLTD